MDKDEILLNEEWAVIGLPPNTVEAEINLKVFHEGTLIKVTRTMDMKEVKTAFRKAEDGYIDEDDEFVLTEKGKAWLEEMNGISNNY